ncbi:hypothetical protein [Hydrogenimonas sp.]
MRKMLLATAVAATLMAAPSPDPAKIETLKPGEVKVLKGWLVYSKPLRFDYDRDGKPNEVVMASRFFIKRTAKGSYEGYIERGLYDIDKRKPVRWYTKRNMLSEPPVGIDIAVKEVKVAGSTVTFTSGGLTYTMTDGGAGHLRDRVVVTDGIRTRQVTLYDGEIEVYR